MQLWSDCDLVVPWNNPHKDIARKLAVQPDLLLVGEITDALTADDGQAVIIASVMVGYDGHRGWINYLAVAPDQRRNGYGRAMMIEAERRLRDLGCPKINLQVRVTNRSVITFYETLGFAVDEVANLGKRLIDDSHSS